jgi:hypothetical protein
VASRQPLYVYVIGAKTAWTCAASQTVLTRYKLLEIERTDYKDIEKWWEIVCSAYLMVSLQSSVFQASTIYTPKTVQTPSEKEQQEQQIAQTPFSHHMYLCKNNFIFISEILEHIFYIVNQMRPAFIGIQFYPLVFDKAPQYFYAIQFRRIFWKIKNV